MKQTEQEWPTDDQDVEALGFEPVDARNFPVLNITKQTGGVQVNHSRDTHFSTWRRVMIFTWE